MAKTLTDVSIKNLKPGATPREIADGGARGLYLWIGATGVKSFVMRYRLGGKPQKLTLGRWLPPEDRKKAATEAQVGDPMSLASARKLAAETMLQVGRGRDPGAIKRDDKEARQQAAADTFETITNEYFRRVAGMKGDDDNRSFDRNKLRSAAERYAALKKRVFPVIGQKPISEIRRGDIIRLLDTIEDEAGPVMADRVLAYIRKVFNWHAVRDEKFNSPIVKGMAKTKPAELARDRILTDDELGVIWKAAGEGPFAALVKFLLLTGARRTEAAAMTWAEVENGSWTLPAARNKTKVDFVRPLSKAAQEILAGRPRFNEFVFSTGRSSFSGFSKAKKEFDTACGVTDWALHDLRRTARSLMSRAGVNSDHAEIALGHKLPGVRGVYDRHQYQEEKQQAFEALAQQIERIVNPPTGNVVAFQKAGE
jgi:integrase